MSMPIMLALAFVTIGMLAVVVAFMYLGWPIILFWVGNILIYVGVKMEIKSESIRTSKK